MKKHFTILDEMFILKAVKTNHKVQRQFEKNPKHVIE